jgi:hypothetical protein
MKLLLIFITLLFAGQPENQKAEIYGHWKLIKIEIENEVLTPELIDYYLTVTTEKLSYNLDVNKCQSIEFSTAENRLEVKNIMRTEICCDGKIDSISNFIHYNGIYEISENQLIITSADSKLFLERQID